MTEPTHTENPPAIPRAIGWCSWHKGIGEDIRLIEVDEAGSGSGANHFACPRCRDRFNLIPLADRP